MFLVIVETAFKSLNHYFI